MLFVFMVAGQLAKAEGNSGAGNGQGMRKIGLLPTEKRSLFLSSVLVDGEYVGFVVDSGYSLAVAMSKNLAEKQKKSVTAQGDASGIGGKVESGVSEFKEIVIGQMVKMPAGPYRVLDLSHLKMRIKGKEESASGLLGAPFLASMRAVFDYESASLWMPAKDAPAGVYKQQREVVGDHVFPLLKGKDSFAFAKVKIQGKEYAFLIDTGASLNLMQPAVAEKLQLKAEDTSAGAVGGGKEQSHQNMKRVKVMNPMIAEKIALESMGFYLMDTGHLLDAPEGMEFGGIIGTELLDFLKAKIDFDSYSLVLPKTVGKKDN